MLSSRSYFGSKPGSPFADTAEASRITGRSVVAVAFTEPSYQSSKEWWVETSPRRGRERIWSARGHTHCRNLHPVPFREPCDNDGPASREYGIQRFHKVQS